MDIFEAYQNWPEDIRAKLSVHDLRRMSGWAPRPTGAWALDHSAGTPILVYEKCSVIEDEQARYVLHLIAMDAERRAQVEALRAERRWIPTSERLPEDGQSVAFVVKASGTWAYLDGLVLGGTYSAQRYTGGFGVPGLVVPAHCWQPMPPPGSTYSDGMPIERPVTVAWQDGSTGEIFGIEYEVGPNSS